MITAIIQAFERQYDSIIVPHIMSSSDISGARLYNGKIDIGLVEINAELQKNTNLSLKPLFEKHIIFMYLKMTSLLYRLILR